MPMIIAIGEPHPVLVGKHLTEGTVLSLAPDDFSIYAIVDHPNTREMQQSQTGPIRIGLAPAGDHTFFLIMKPGDLIWTDMPFSLGALEPDQRDVLPPRDDNEGYVIHYTLSDLTTRIVCALRMFTITPAFATALEQQIEKLRLNLPRFTQQKHHAEIRAFYRRYPNQNQMGQAAMIVETAGMKYPR